jgi:hypothetical protein
VKSVLWLNEKESFSITGYVEAPGYIRTPLQGYIVEQRGDGVYAAPLLPQLFYGADGNQLQTWRQYIPNTGSQVILSRSGGQPSLPREELAWRKIKSYQTSQQPQQNTAQRSVTQRTTAQTNPLGILILIGLAILVIGSHK